MKVSVIVPVYNVEDYIDRCLDSLANQNFNDYEVIVVNDGSPDNSQKIIDKYVKKYPYIFKSFIKKNGGLSDARNYGLKYAKGDFIAFVDSDDYIDSKMLEKLYNKAIENDFDVTVCDINYVFKNKEKVVSSLVKSDILSKDNVKKAMINIYPATWNKLYKKSLFASGIKFKKGVWYEDVEFLYRLFPYIKSIGVVPEGLYNYVQREDGIIKTFDKRLYNYIDNWNGIVDFYKEKDFYEEYYLELEYSYVRYLFTTFVKGATNFSFVEYKKACETALGNVRKRFPDYRKNIYLKGAEGFYLKHFGSFFQKLVYLFYHK